MAEPIKDPLYEVERDIKMCRRCSLYEHRDHVVPGSGNTRASIFLIGEAPGENEDREGEPFVGKSGHKLDEWLSLVGLSREHLYITNLLKCRPPENKFPEETGKEAPTTQCLPYLREQLRIVNPLAIVLMGKQAVHHVLLPGSADYAAPFDKWIGRVCRRRDVFGEARFGVMYHPAHVLRSKNPREEQQCVTLLKTIKAHVAAKLRGEPAPLLDLYDVKPIGAPTFQQRFRLFGSAPEEAKGDPK